MIKLHWINYIKLLVFIVFLFSGCERSEPQTEQETISNASQENSVAQEKKSEPEKIISPIVAAARKQIGKTLIYDSSYTALKYPMGDVPIERGVCTDVVIRAFRDALQMDLQKLVHEDMSAAFSKYPDIWGLKKPDSNIDHRRVPNLMTYFERKGYSIAITQEKDDYFAGDIVTCSVQNRPHIMIVSDRLTQDGIPLVIHNIGRGTKEENLLFEFPLTGHYRFME